MAINFFQEDIEFVLPRKLKIKKWLNMLAKGEGYTIKSLNYIFCSDEYLYEMNLSYLQHNTYTDILTFDTGEDGNVLEGDVFISIDRVRENAANQKLNFSQELSRVLCHGLFHLCGFGDREPEEITLMRNKEDEALSLLSAPAVPRGTA